jgi:hypothetical protein
VETVTVEQIQIQPKTALIEQQQQPVTTTTEVEKPTVPQVTADASSTQPKTEEQVSHIDFAVDLCVMCCERKTKTLITKSFVMNIIFCVSLKYKKIRFNSMETSILANFDNSNDRN